MLIAADVGNSGVKVGAFDGDSLISTARLDLPPGGDLRDLLGLGGAGVSAIVCVSVHEPALRAFLDGPGRGALVLGHDLPLLVPNRYERPEEVGRDRLVDAAAAHARAKGAAVVADLGSAVTVDVVSEAGEFLGGAIAPGRGALAQGLAASAPALPSYDGGEPLGGVPRSTRDAIRAGVVRGLAGLTERLLKDALAALRPTVAPVYLTGGDAGLVAPALEVPAEVVPHLTLTGIRLLYDRARREGSE